MFKPQKSPTQWLPLSPLKSSFLTFISVRTNNPRKDTWECGSWPDLSISFSQALPTWDYSNVNVYVHGINHIADDGYIQKIHYFPFWICDRTEGEKGGFFLVLNGLWLYMTILMTSACNINLRSGAISLKKERNNNYCSIPLDYYLRLSQHNLTNTFNRLTQFEQSFVQPHKDMTKAWAQQWTGETSIKSKMTVFMMAPGILKEFV